MGVHMLRYRELVALALIISAAVLVSAGIGVGTGIANSSNSTVRAVANSSIIGRLNYTVDYVEMVNRSAYLIFYPNLAKAYSYIDEANAIAESDPARAASLLDMAVEYSRVQLDMLNGLRDYSLVVLTIITALLGFEMYRLMRVRS